MPKKVVWMSQHVPLVRQLGELERLFPDHHLVIDARSFDSADDIIARFRAMGGHELVVVAPLDVKRAIIQRGIRPIWAEMEQVPCRSNRVEVRIGRRRPRCYRFKEFHRLRDITLSLEPLTPERSD